MSRNQQQAVLEAGWGFRAPHLAPLGDGHINDTLLVRAPWPSGLATALQSTLTPAEEGTGVFSFVLQRINQTVFTDPARVTSNLRRVVHHLEGSGVPLAPLLPTSDGEAAWVDEHGDWWRLWGYVTATRSLSRTDELPVAEAAGRAFGAFQSALADLPAPPLEATIPGFLELRGYLQQFDAVRGSSAALAREADACIGATLDASAIEALRGLADRFPPKNTLIHGDCKLNNLLFAADAPVVRAVVDLDTVMGGHWAWDFGDLARSLLNAASDSGKGAEIFLAAARGFLEGANRRASADDLALALHYVAFMLGIRFLTDHLEGDRYFKVARSGDNLARARVQFELLRRFPAEALAAVVRPLPQVVP
ncbi:MAG: aminoglycoside phosphotransferase family protein [Pseudomonadota bacterium]